MKKRKRSPLKQKTRRQRTRKEKKKIQTILFLIIWPILVGVAFFLILLLLSDDPINQNQEQSLEAPKEEFIDQLAPHAQELQREYGILPSIILGQAILESDWGRSELSRDYYNLFGMKAHGDVKKVFLATKEFVDGEWHEVQAEFRVYENWQESMDDHTQLFVKGVTWNKDLYRGVLQASDYRVAAKALQTAGYATDPLYEQKIIEVIEKYQLYLYD